MSLHRPPSSFASRTGLPLAAALASSLFALSARADVLVYDEHDGRSGGTVGWAEDWPFQRANGELVQTAGYPRRHFNASVGGAGATLWIAITGRASTIVSGYSYHTPMGTTGWAGDYQHPGLHFSGGKPRGFVGFDDDAETGIPVTTQQTWLARYDFGPALAGGRFDIMVSIWAARGRGEAIELDAPPRFTTLLEDATLDSMYSGQDAEGPIFYVDRESVATTAEEALGLRRDLNIVAHQDDDLLFMSPDLSNSIRSDNIVRTIYVTDGAAGAPEMRDFRERGVMSAYAEMAGLPNVWTIGELIVAGKHLKLAVLDERVSLVFLRLPASPADGQFPKNELTNALAKLYSVPGYSLADTNQGDVYTRADLIEVLSQLIAGYAPTQIHSLDNSIMHSSDHEEHLFTAFFTQEARNTYSAAHVLRIYRGYNIGWATENLTAGQAAAKFMTFRWYDACDHFICDDNGKPPEVEHRGCVRSSTGIWSCPLCGADYGCVPTDTNYYEYSKRQYSLGEVPQGSMRFVNRFNPSKCLTASGGSLVLAPCANLPAQSFTLTADHHLVAAGGQCVEMAAPGAAYAYAVGLMDCAAVLEQHWTVTEDGLIAGAGGTCLEPTDGLQNATGIDAQIGCVGYTTQLWTAVP